MSAFLLTRVFAEHVLQERRARRSAAALHRVQQHAIARLRRFAYACSPFYRRFHRGLERAPLNALPVLDKSTLMAEFDSLVTDDRVRLADVSAHLATTPQALFNGQYVVLASSGSTGQRAVFLFSRREWIGALAAITRPPAWADAPKPWTRPRAAVIASTEPWHYSGRIAHDLQSALFPTWHADASWPIDDLVTGLNAWQPDVLAVYPSTLVALTEEQQARRLCIAPQHIGTSAEVLTPLAREQARIAFGTEVFDTYGATELSPIASQCKAGSMHLFEDRALLEVVDERGEAVPTGTLGAQLLMTVFDRYTQPLIRYRLEDNVREVPGPCACGRATRRIAHVEGRIEESLVLPQVAGQRAVCIHPNALHRLIEGIPCSGWQVRQLDAGASRAMVDATTPPRLEVLLVGRPQTDASVALAQRLDTMLRAMGAGSAGITIRWVSSLPRGRSGKAPLIVRTLEDLPESHDQ